MLLNKEYALFNRIVSIFSAKKWLICLKRTNFAGQNKSPMLATPLITIELAKPVYSINNKDFLLRR
jgi:hypothetical protein